MSKTFKTPLIKEFDEMRKKLNLDTKQSKIMTDFRKKLVATERHSELLGYHFDYVLNSGEMSDRHAKELGLL